MLALSLGDAGPVHCRGPSPDTTARQETARTGMAGVAVCPMGMVRRPAKRAAASGSWLGR
jgi:hypothetical protein